jgi:hypothetical protein
VTTIKAHFDGEAFVPDEPVDLPVNQAVVLHVEIVPAFPPPNPSRPKMIGSAKGRFVMSDDWDEPLEDFKPYM